MTAADGLAGLRQFATRALADARDLAPGASQTLENGYIVTREKMDPSLLRELRQAHNELADVLGLPRMFNDLMADIEHSRVSGSTPEETLELIIDKLRNTTTKWEIRDELHPLKQIVGGLEIPQPMETLRRQTLEQLQNNIDRMDGVLVDGFGRYPDYAELGRALAGSELLLNVHRSGASPSAKSVATAERAATELLSW